LRIGRLLSALVSVSLLSAPLAVVAAPAASAAETFPTRTVIAVEKNKMRFNDTFDVEG
jgi:hypothetical protein